MAGEPTSAVADESDQADLTFLEDRYGARQKSTSRRWRVWLYTAIAVLAGGVVAWIGYQNLGAAPIDAERVGFVAKPDNSIAITINVTRDDPSKAGVCIVDSLDLTGMENGRKEVLIPPGSDSTALTTGIKTIDAPVTADVYGCSYNVPEYMSSFGRPTG